MRQDDVITKIEITNFQSHASTTLELGNFTAITGHSSSGKSSVIRALNWLFYGDWDQLFPADPSKPTAVAVTLADGTRIVRMRQDKNNRAAIVRPGQEPLKFKDFGEEIPGVFNLINVRKIEMADRSVNLNISDQDDPLFLVNTKHWTKPARAQWLGRLYGAHVVNTMLRLMASDKKEAEKRIKDIEESMSGLERRRRAYDNVPAQEEAVDAAEALLAQLASVAGVIRDLEAYRSKVQVLATKKWVYEVDTMGMRRHLQQLEALQELRSRRQKVMDLQNRVQAKAAFRGVDTAALRGDLARLSSFIELRDRTAKVRATEAKVAAKANLASFDPRAARANLDSAAALSKLKTDLGRFQQALAAVKAKAWLKKVDPVAMRNDALLLANLKMWHGEKTQVSLRWATTTVKLQGKERDLKEAYDRAGGYMFAEGSCPLCKSDGVKIDSATAVAHLKEFLGANA